MQSFNTADARHPFEVDGKTYYLPAVSIEDISGFSELAKLEPTEQARQFRAILEGKALAGKLTWWQKLTNQNPGRKAVEQLSLSQLSELFTEWASASKAVSPGERSRSAA